MFKKPCVTHTVSTDLEMDVTKYFGIETRRAYKTVEVSAITGEARRGGPQGIRPHNGLTHRRTGMCPELQAVTPRTGLDLGVRDGVSPVIVNGEMNCHTISDSKQKHRYAYHPER